ncbi:hypothetical protein HH212_14115 [Massilia forsythiae]|uniref:Lipoprotein n=1 Tax=Massilia forsythiae TaxID=2728020 RepID=A0A7Z2VXG6_9BURK|nr:hypothetical protein [Massilia forsythiae]QJE01024.1 hypothetical protein HH212_14115 [Massilia forsythiae]
MPTPHRAIRCLPGAARAPFAALLCAALLAGCSALHGRMPAPAAPLRSTPSGLADAGGAPIQKIPFRTGVSSATVETMARKQACSGGQGAGLITDPGPVEVYRMQCDDGKVFMARCELRQCRQM